MSKKSQRKGSLGERELKQLIFDELGVTVHRNNDQYGANADHDLIGMAPFALEVKRRQRLTALDVRRFWNQASIQAHGAYIIPALAYRSDRAPWRFVLPIYALDDRQLGTPNHDYEWTAELSLVAFCAVVREHMSMARENNGG